LSFSLTITLGHLEVQVEDIWLLDAPPEGIKVRLGFQLSFLYQLVLQLNNLFLHTV